MRKMLPCPHSPGGDNTPPPTTEPVCDTVFDCATSVASLSVNNGDTGSLQCGQSVPVSLLWVGCDGQRVEGNTIRLSVDGQEITFLNSDGLTNNYSMVVPEIEGATNLTFQWGNLLDPSPCTASVPVFIQCDINLDHVDRLLSDPARIGFGGETTGGTNEVIVSTLQEFADAVAFSGNCVRLAPSLAGQTLFFEDTIDTSASNLTIDGQDAPGVTFCPSSNFQSSRVMLYLRGSNVIVNDVAFDGKRWPAINDNVGGLRFSGQLAWFNKISATGLPDDAIDLVVTADDITISKLHAYNTSKAVHGFYTNSNDRRVSLHSSLLTARDRNPWNQGTANFHMWNNVIDAPPDYNYSFSAGLTTGNNNSQWTVSGFSQLGPANTISEHNIYKSDLEFTITAFNDSGNSVRGFIHSNDDDIAAGSAISGGSNITYTTSPSLFSIPYSYSLLPTSQVEAYVLANAGSS